MATNGGEARAVAKARAGADKAAVLLLGLGPEVASGVLAHLSEAEVRQLSEAMARVQAGPRVDARAVHEEAWRWLSSAEASVARGEDLVRRVVGTVAGRDEPGDRGAASAPAASSIAARLAGVAPQALAKVLADEHPQVAALVVAHLDTRQAAEVLVQLPEPVQVDLVYRIAELRSVADDVLADVESAIAGQVQRLGAAGQAGVPTGGAKFAADVMNLVGSFTEQRIFAGLDERSTAVADAIRSLMLTFEDLQRLDNRGMQTLLKDVGRDELLLAMKTASPAMREKILANLSARARDIMQEDLATLGPVRLKDVERAQAVIVFAARRLAEEQKLHLGVSLDDALV